MNTDIYDSATQLMKEKRWGEASNSWDHILKLFPNCKKSLMQSSISYYQQKKFEDALFRVNKYGSVFFKDKYYYLQKAKILLGLERYEEAYKILINMPLKNLKILSAYMYKLESEDLIYSSLKALALEEFDYKKPTYLTLLMHKLYRHDRGTFNKYVDYMKRLSKCDSFSLASVGLLQHLEDDFVERILKTGDKAIILKIFSMLPIHRKNIEKLTVIGVESLTNNKILYSAYKNLLSPSTINLTESEGKRELKIALCISGQLRGFKEAYETWGNFEFDNHKVDKFVCVWSNIGRKMFHKGHFSRIFPKNLANVFSKIMLDKEANYIEQILPSLYKFLNSKNTITYRELNEVYQTKNVKIIDDKKFVANSNAYKMHFMINQCWNMIPNPDEYDLVIRIRPDKSLLKSNINLDELSSQKLSNCVLPDKAASLHLGNVYMGDQFAIAQPRVMSIYSNTYSEFINKKGIFELDEYKELMPHASLNATMLENDIDIIDHKGLLEFGVLNDPSKIKLKKLSELIEKDLGNNENLKKLFVDAINLDSLGLGE